MKHLALLAVIALAACGGGGGTSPTPIAITTTSPATSPVTSPTSAPTTTPNSLHVAAAPAQVFTAQGLVRRSAPEALRQAQAVNLGSGGVPTVVVGFSATMGGIFSQFYTWAATASAIPVPESSLIVTPAGPITIQAVNEDNTNLFAATTHDWIVNPGPLTGTGKISMGVAFGDGTAGTVPYFAYDKWNLGISASPPTAGEPQKWTYQNGVPVGGVAAADVALDGAGNIDFPNGASLVAAPVADAYGNVATAFTTTLTATFTNPVTVVSLASLQDGAIYLVKLNDGGFAKFMALQNDEVPASSPSLFGISEHDSPSGSRTFAF